MQSRPESSDGKYKQIYYKRNRDRPYTSGKVGEDDYLQTEVWRELRNERLKKDMFQCQMCGKATNVVVHHLQYPKIWGTENVDMDLITLCRECHDKVHSRTSDTDETPF